jgi:hypothetical protein
LNGLQKEYLQQCQDWIEYVSLCEARNLEIAYTYALAEQLMLGGCKRWYKNKTSIIVYQLQAFSTWNEQRMALDMTLNCLLDLPKTALLGPNRLASLLWLEDATYFKELVSNPLTTEKVRNCIEHVAAVTVPMRINMLSTLATRISSCYEQMSSKLSVAAATIRRMDGGRAFSIQNAWPHALLQFVPHYLNDVQAMKSELLSSMSTHMNLKLQRVLTLTTSPLYSPGIKLKLRNMVANRIRYLDSGTYYERNEMIELESYISTLSDCQIKLHVFSSFKTSGADLSLLTPYHVVNAFIFIITTTTVDGEM